MLTFSSKETIPTQYGCALDTNGMVTHIFWVVFISDRTIQRRKPFLSEVLVRTLTTWLFLQWTSRLFRETIIILKVTTRAELEKVLVRAQRYFNFLFGSYSLFRSIALPLNCRTLQFNTNSFNHETNKNPLLFSNYMCIYTEGVPRWFWTKSLLLAVVGFCFSRT